MTGIPHLLVIDPEGIVRWEGHPLDLTETKLEGILQSWRPTKAQNAQLGAKPLPPKPKKRFSFKLKDGRLIKGEWIGSFGNRTTVFAEDGTQVDIKESDILSREELKSANASEGR